MSGFEDLEDDIPEQVDNRRGGDLFDEDDDEDFNPTREAPAQDEDEDELADEDAGPAPAAPAAGGGGGDLPLARGDMKARLQALAAKKRQEEEEGGTKKRRKEKGEKEGKEGGKDKDKKRKREGKDKDKGSKRSARLKEAAEGGGADGGEAKAARRSKEDGPQGSIDSKELAEDDADKEFIDDEVDKDAEEEPIGSDVVDDEDEEGGQGPQEPPPEAEEAADAEEDLFGKSKKKKRQESDAQMLEVVNDKIGKMDAAAEEDVQEHEAKRPAVNKLRMLAEVQAFLSQSKYHELFIQSGGLGVLKAWLEPYPDTTLPNVKVRTAVLDACKTLPIDTEREDIKDNLKRSELGKLIMFLAKCPTETQSNQRLAIELVQKWSRPIFRDAEAEAEKRRIKEEALRRARAHSLETQKAKEAAEAEVTAQRNKIKHGQPGYRWHAVIPQSSKLDYVVQPERDMSLAAQAAAPVSKKDEGKLAKKMREVVRRQKGSTARAAVPSVEGRNIVL